MRRGGAAAWSALGVLILVVVLALALWHLRLIVLPVIIAALVSVGLSPVHGLFVQAGASRGLAAALVLVLGVAALTAAGFLIVPAVADQLGDLGRALDDAGDRLERWVARERPFGMDGGDVARLRDRIRSTEATGGLDVSARTGIRAASEIVAGLLLVVVTTFFLLRDGPAMRRALAARAPREWERRVVDTIDGVVGSLRAYLMGAASLGVVEGIAVGLALALSGADLAFVVAALTFVAAFVPFVGAIFVGLIAIGVALVSGGMTSAIVVAIVVVVVQQFDNELLAPFIYGRLLHLHPLAVILGTAIGIEVAGLIGAFVTVPLIAAASGAWRANRSRAALGVGPAVAS